MCDPLFFEGSHGIFSGGNGWLRGKMQGQLHFTAPIDFLNGEDIAVLLQIDLDIACVHRHQHIPHIFCSNRVFQRTVEGRKVAIQTTEQHFLVTGKFADWVERFPHYYFRRVHNSFLVNLHHVEKYAYSELIMSDNSRIPIAPRKRTEFRVAWFEYLGRR